MFCSAHDGQVPLVVTLKVQSLVTMVLILRGGSIELYKILENVLTVPAI